MNFINKELEEADLAEYSNLINIQFVEFARIELISNYQAKVRFIERFTELYGAPLGGPEKLGDILNGKTNLPCKVCVASVKEYMHCPLIGVFKSLIAGSLNTELVDLSNLIVARALAS